MSASFFERVAALQREGQRFAVATVVARRAPVSAHLGDRAIIFADGRFEGFVGGACSRDIIRQQALAAMEARRGRLVSIRPDASGPGDAEHVVVPMTCASEGAVDVYVEPFVPARRFVVIGATPVAEALARLGAPWTTTSCAWSTLASNVTSSPAPSLLAGEFAPLDALEQSFEREAEIGGRGRLAGPL